MRPVVLAHQRGEVWRYRAKPDGACREVHVVRVLGATWVGLQAVELPHHGEVRRVEVAKEVLNRVIDRRRVRLDRYTISRPHEVEVERGHQT